MARRGAAFTITRDWSDICGAVYIVPIYEVGIQILIISE